ELRTDLFQQRRLEDAGGLRRGVAILVEDVPSAEHEIVEPGERHDLTDFRRTSVGALAQTDGSHLRQRADWLGEAFPDSEHARDRRRADGTEADEQNTEL